MGYYQSLLFFNLTKKKKVDENCNYTYLYKLYILDIC